MRTADLLMAMPAVVDGLDPGERRKLLDRVEPQYRDELNGRPSDLIRHSAINGLLFELYRGSADWRDKAEAVWGHLERAAGRIEKALAGSQSDRLGAARQTFRRWLHLPDDDHVVVALGVVAANLLSGDPVWLLFVGPPGSGKTEAIQPLTALEYVYPIATLTEPALLSGVPKKSVEADATGGVLRQIGSFGVLLVKDFSGVLGMHRDARSAVLAALREIHDGSWSRPVGTGGGKVLTWTGKAGIVGAVTPSIDRHTSVMGALGERFLLYRLADSTGNAKAARALANFGDEATMRRELADAAGTVLAGITRQAPDRLTDDEQQRIVALAAFAVHARSAVERDGYSRTVAVMPEAEHPTRLAKQLAQLRAGVLAIGADDATAWRITYKAAADSIPGLRWTLLETLRVADYPQTTSDLLDRTGIPRKTMEEHLEDLALLGLVRREKAGSAQNSPWVQSLSDLARRLWPEPLAREVGDSTAGLLAGNVGWSENPINNPQPISDDFSRQPATTTSEVSG